MEIIDLNKKNQKVVKFNLLKNALEKIEPGTRILDIGCGKCDFLLTLKKFFPEANYFGCDIAPIDEFTEKEIEFKKFNLNEKELPYPDNFFDIVIMIDLLEHVSNPEKVLKETRRILKNGGKFFLHVPTEKESFIFYRIWCRLTGTEYKRDFGEHTQCFTRQELLSFLKNNDFLPISIRYNYHLIGGVRDTLKFILTARRQKAKKVGKFPRGQNDIALLAGRFGRSVFFVLDFLSYYESKILSRISFGAMAMNVFVKIR